MHAVFPNWLTTISAVSLVLAFGCALYIALDELKRPQKTWIMNGVWPLTALFGSVIWLTFYLKAGRGVTRSERAEMERKGEEKGDTPMAIAVAKGASHCGAGCTLGDIIAEWLAFGVPSVAVALGWKSIFPEKMFSVWILDYLVAFVIGVAFQYFTIKPMRDLSVGQAIWQALKADTASITSWQVGMYGFMAVAQFMWFQPFYGGTADVDTPVFWFAMQIAMLCGFVTAYPTNWLLVKAGVKEKM